MFEQLKGFHHRFGHFGVFPDKRPQSLFRWLERQQILYKHDKLRQDRKLKFDEIHFPWNNNFPKRPTAKHTKWNAKFKCLKDYHEKHGHIRVPYSNHPDSHLGLWIRQQRSKQETLTKEQKEKLDALGFQWNKQSGKRWHDDILEKYGKSTDEYEKGPKPKKTRSAPKDDSRINATNEMSTVLQSGALRKSATLQAGASLQSSLPADQPSAGTSKKKRGV
jgi:hypothetical protein